MTEYTLEEQKANRKLWIEALRSGEFKQGTSYLYSNGRFCCLGVACVIAGKSADEIDGYGVLSDEVADVRLCMGLSDDVGTFGIDDSDDLARINDRGGTFTEIADIIESEPPGLFVESA